LPVVTSDRQFKVKAQEHQLDPLLYFATMFLLKKQ
jgi:hypothetical protein